MHIQSNLGPTLPADQLNSTCTAAEKKTDLKIDLPFVKLLPEQGL